MGTIKPRVYIHGHRVGPVEAALVSRLKYGYCVSEGNFKDSEAETSQFTLFLVKDRERIIELCAKAVEFASRNTFRTLFCFLPSGPNGEFTPNEAKQLDFVSKIIANLHGKTFTDLEDVAQYLNQYSGKSRNNPDFKTQVGALHPLEFPKDIL